MGTLSDNTYNPSADASWMTVYNVDTSKLTKNREAVLNTAFNMTTTNCTYKMDGATMDKERLAGTTPSVIDCSGYVCRVYYDAGFTNYKNRIITSGWPSSSLWEPVKYSDIAPGDTLVFDSSGVGHALIYVSGSSTKLSEVIVLQSTNMGGKNGPQIGAYKGRDRGIDTKGKAANDGVYHCYKFKEIESDKSTIKTKTY